MTVDIVRRFWGGFANEWDELLELGDHVVWILYHEIWFNTSRDWLWDFVMRTAMELKAR